MDALSYFGREFRRDKLVEVHFAAVALRKSAVGAGHYQSQRRPRLQSFGECAQYDVSALAQVKSADEQQLIGGCAVNIPAVCRSGGANGIGDDSGERQLEPISLSQAV